MSASVVDAAIAAQGDMPKREGDVLVLVQDGKEVARLAASTKEERERAINAWAEAAMARAALGRHADIVKLECDIIQKKAEVDILELKLARAREALAKP